MSRYTSATDADRAAMLEAIGVGSVEELFADIPEAIRLGRALDLAAGRPSRRSTPTCATWPPRNVSAEDEISFLGAGMYDHYVPALVERDRARSEFLTPYTPYQPEVSQGGLQVMFEYQTAISELTGLPVSNACVYEGPSAVAAAGYLARLANGQAAGSSSRAGLHPHSRETLATLARGYGVEIVEVAARGRRHRRRRAGRRDRRRHRRGVPAAAELPRRRRGPRRRSPAPPRRTGALRRRAPPTRSRSAS